MKIGLILRNLLVFIIFGTIFSFGAVFSIGDTSAIEGSNETFTVTISGPCQQGVRYDVDYATSNGTATEGTDYTKRTGTVSYTHSTATVNSGQCGTKTFTVPTTNDGGYESDETFNVTLSKAKSNNATYPASIGDGSAIGTIVNNDTTKPNFRIENVSKAEGNSGTSNLHFTITITGTCAANEPYTVDYTTSDGTATAGSDYVYTHKTAIFKQAGNGACGPHQGIDIPIIVDTDYEEDEVMFLTLSNTSNNAILNPSKYIATGTIRNDDATPPIFSIANASKVEGNSGTSNLEFTITLTGTCVANKAYTVNYATSNGAGAAVAGSDYTATNNSVTFTSSTNGTCGTRKVSVPIIGDTVYEDDEAFLLTLSNPSNATLGAGVASGVITNDDNVPSDITTSFGNIRHQMNLKGNMKVIGNTVLCPKDQNGACTEATTANSNVDLNYTKLPTDITNASIFNSSKAALVDSVIDPTKSAKVKWAGLYWSGYLSKSNYTRAKANELIDNHTVKLSVHDGSYVDISSHTVLGRFANGNYRGTSYGCFADVTNIMKDMRPEGNYSVANIPSTEGETWVSQGDGLGNSGAWSLVVIYENINDSKTRNATVFDGFARVDAGNDAIINVSGFKTPKSGSVDSALSVFANEGDKYIPGDQFKFKNLDGDNQSAPEKILSSSDGNSNYFNSSITGVDDRTPTVGNNNGIDIHTDQMGTDGYKMVSTNQTKARITLTSTGDVYYPVMVGFATELYIPKLCYDYSATIDGVSLARKDLTGNYIATKNGVLESKVFIRDLEGDFPLENASMSVSWQSNPAGANFALLNNSPNKVKVKNPSSVSYADATGVSGIGTNTATFDIGDGTNHTIPAYSSIYAIVPFDAKKVAGDELEISVGVTAQYRFDTTSDYIPYLATELTKCPGTITYNPQWYQFNIENSVKDVAYPYALNTQVTNTPMSFKVVSYHPYNLDARTGYSGALEVEMIDLSTMDSFSDADIANDDTINPKYAFNRICEDPDPNIVKLWGGKDTIRKFTDFNGASAVDLNIKASENTNAMRNGAFRLWILTKDTDKDGNFDEMATNDCINTSGSCFKTLYANDAYYKTVNTCDTQCSASSSDEACYKCLRETYGKPICSRDNFAVRPYGVELSAKSMTAEIQKNNQAPNTIRNLLSGWVNDYTAEFVAKNQNLTVPIGYFFNKYSTETKDVSQVDMSASDKIFRFFGLRLDNDKINSKDYTKCADSNHKRFDFDKENDVWKLENTNVGNYDIVLFDKDWTIVDQVRYDAYRPKASKGHADCELNSAILSSSEKNGCDIKSFEVNGNDTNFNKIPVKFVPAKIDVQSLAYGSYPNNHDSKWAYMSNLTDSSAMGAQFAGTIVATNGEGLATSNFTSSCFAQDVNFLNQYSTTQLDANGEVIASNVQGILTVGDKINLQQAYSFNDDNSFTAEDATVLSTTEQTDEVNNDYQAQLKVKKENFADDKDDGKLVSDIRYNIKKLYYMAVNPIKMLFVKLNSQLLDDDGTPTKVWKAGYAPTTDLATLPEGSTFEIIDEKSLFSHDNAKGIVQDVLDKSFNFLYSRVYTEYEKDGLVDGRRVLGTSTAAHFKVVVYSPTSPTSDSVLKNVLDGSAIDGIPNWYLAKTHSLVPEGDPIGMDGKIDSITQAASKGPSTISSGINSIYFDKDATPSGMSNDITYSYNGERLNRVVYTVTPSIWLKYNSDISKNGLPQFVLSFVEPGYNWVGKGNTGNVVKIPITPNAKYR